MTVKKLQFLMVVLLAVTISSCEKDPSTSNLHRDYLVYTAHDTDAKFSDFDTYYIPDSILLIGNNKKTEYWKDANAMEIVNTVVSNMDARGYSRIDDKEMANLGIQLSYVTSVSYFVGYDDPYWWWYYPYYWAPGYWGDWLGWHYPYSVYYSYTAGSLLMEMIDLTSPPTDNKKLPIIWDSYIGGLLTSSEALNQERTVAAIKQAFEQSPYLKK